MKFLLTDTKIKKLCGMTAYKTGKSYYRAGKVEFVPSDASETQTEAVVKTGENFHVTVKHEASGDISAQCSCPPVGFVPTYCQHIAAVLIAIEDRQTGNPLASRMLGLFDDGSMPPSAKQLHFDRRQLLHVEFTCRPVFLRGGEYGFGIQLRAGFTALENILDIPQFLAAVELREPVEYAPGFTYLPDRHSFTKETDNVLQFLVKSRRLKSKIVLQEEMLLVSALDWEQLLPLLSAAPKVGFLQDGQFFAGVRFIQKLPLRFKFDEAVKAGYRLNVEGLEGITVLKAYGYALSKGGLFKLPQEDANRLAELKGMLEDAEEHQIDIPENQIDHFMETVVPGLMKLGHVQVADSVSQRMGETPLRAKVFLDRVKHRLLAGVEFHYGQLILNPCEETEEMLIHHPGLRRQRNKEQQIIRLLLDHSFVQTAGGFYVYDEEAEYDFLTRGVPELEKLVQIYATTAVKMRITKAYKGPRIKIEVGERTDWLAFRFDLKDIPEKEIRKLLTSIEKKQKYYRIPNGTLLSLETEEYSALNDLLASLKLSAEDIDGQEIRVPLIQGMQIIDELGQSNMVDAGENFARLLKNLNNPEETGFPVPKELQGILRDYQQAGFQWFKTLAKYRFGGILADDMGLGKTVQSIAFIDSVLPDIRTGKSPALIVAPSSLVYNWRNELQKFTPHINIRVIDGTRAARAALWNRRDGADVLIVSYPSLRMDAQHYRSRKFHSVFFDEAQAFKNPVTQTAKAVKMIQADYRFALTGTPIENSLDELWSIFHVIFPGLLPGRKAFSELSRENIAKRVKPFILRRLKQEVLTELPNKVETMRFSELHIEQKTLYAAYLAELKHDALKHLAKGTLKKNRIRILAGMTRLRQLCCHPALFVEGYSASSAKYEQLLEIIDECRISGRRVLVFSQFTQMLGIIGRQLGREGVPYFYLDGQTPPSERVELCDRFNDGEGNLFLISLKAGGTGLNLAGADTVILYDLWWNPAVEQQAADRAHRMGQLNEVQVIRLVAKGTIEEKINELQQRKRNLIDEVIQSGKDSLTAMTEQDIREILMIE